MEDKEVKRILRCLVDCKFREVWEGEKLEDFYRFIAQQAVPAGSFLLTFPIYLDENREAEGWAWFCYRIKGVEPGRVKFDGYPEIRMPTTEEYLRECPQDWKGLPVWRLNLGKG